MKITLREFGTVLWYAATYEVLLSEIKFDGNDEIDLSSKGLSLRLRAYNG